MVPCPRELLVQDRKGAQMPPPGRTWQYLKRVQV